jgi:phospholipase/lecithinase/hemolysin
MFRHMPRMAAACVLAWLAPALQAQSFSELLVFGDSLSDTGNVFSTTGIPQPPYFEGRFSNGPVWHEYLAERLELPPAVASQQGGSNHAWASAETGDGFAPAGVPNIRTQVDRYLATAAPRGDQLIVVWGGGNDFLGGETDAAVPAAHIEAAIRALAAAGGMHFLVPNLPPLSLAPTVASLPAEQRLAVEALGLAFNERLDETLDALETELNIAVFRLDVESLTREVLMAPESFGFVNVTTAALTDGVTSGEGYLLWDHVHPTTAGHQVIGERAFESIQGLGGGLPEATAYRLPAH